MTIIKPQKGDDWDNLCRPSRHHLSPSPRSSKRIILLLYFSFFFLFIYSPLFCLVCDEDANNPGGENTDRGSYPNDFGGRGDMLLRCDGLLRQSAHWLIVIIFSVSLFCVCVCVFAISSRRVFGKSQWAGLMAKSSLSLVFCSDWLSDWARRYSSHVSHTKFVMAGWCSSREHYEKNTTPNWSPGDFIVVRPPLHETKLDPARIFIFSCFVF